VIVKQASSTSAEAEAALLAELERRAIKVFARIDHAAAAREAGIELHDEAVIVFGNPAAGTPLMAHDARVGVELPLKILIWSDGEGTHVGYNDPRELGARYDLAGLGEVLDKMAGLMDQLADAACA
jgi:uncharacterized protein (DUF302 family)